MSTSSSSCRIPDELVLMVIKWCDSLVDKRGKTLAALCLLAKRFTAAAERFLYSDVVLETPLEAGTALSALGQHPRLRKFVMTVDLYLDHDSLGDLKDGIVHVLCGMPNVQHLVAGPAEPATRLLLAHPDCRLRSVNWHPWDDDHARLLVDRPAAFTRLEHADVKFEDGFSVGPPPVLPSMRSLSVSGGHGLPAFGLFTAPLVGQLTYLTIVVWSHPLESANLSAWTRLERLEIYSWISYHRGQLERSIPSVVAILQSVPRTSVLATFDLHLVADEKGGVSGAETPFALPAASNDLLLALPPCVRHLSLFTNAIRPLDLATYLIGPLRPSSLRTLRLGHALGRGFRTILDDADGPHGALAGELERAGIEITTTAVDF
ncbi:hypothetical protein JCM8208_000957 [Rhodotorula glutinis]